MLAVRVCARGRGAAGHRAAPRAWCPRWPTRRAFAFDAPAAIAAAPVTTGMKIERRVQVLRVACWPLELMVSAAAGATSMRQRTVMMDRIALWTAREAERMTRLAEEAVKSRRFRADFGVGRDSEPLTPEELAWGPRLGDARFQSRHRPKLPSWTRHPSAKAESSKHEARETKPYHCSRARGGGAIRKV